MKETGEPFGDEKGNGKEGGGRKRGGEKEKKWMVSRGVDRRVKETSPGKQRTNGNWFVCRYTEEKSNRLHAR